MRPLQPLADAVAAQLATAGIEAPVYVDPVDAAEAPCVIMFAGEVAPRSAAAGSVDYEASVDCIGLRADVAGAVELSDRLTAAVMAACTAVPNAGWRSADGPAAYPLAGIDYLGRKCHVHVALTLTDLGGP